MPEPLRVRNAAAVTAVNAQIGPASASLARIEREEAMIRGVLLITAATTACISNGPAFGRTRSEARRNSSELGYFLPRTRVAATVHQLIRRCPTVGEPEPLVATTIAISERAGPDAAAFVRITLRGGALTGRTTKLGLRQEGTLSSFNATSTGEAGQVLAAVISTATTVASLGAGGGMALDRDPTLQQPLQPSALSCTPETAELVRQMTEIETQIALLRSNVAAGAETPATAQVLTGLTADLVAPVEIALKTEDVGVLVRSDITKTRRANCCSHRLGSGLNCTSR